MSSNRGGYRSRFGDTTLTKVFVGGLAWETPSDQLREHFERYGEILEAVVITDKATGRSKGYGFVTFREPESARQACVEANPVIDGRRANCNIASQGLSTPLRGRNHNQNQNQIGGHYQQYNRMAQPQIPVQPSPQMYNHWYMTYQADYGYQPQGMYNQHLLATQEQFQNQIYAQSRVGGAYAYQQPVGYSVPSASVRGIFPMHPQMQQMQVPAPQTYVQYPPEEGGDEGSLIQPSFNERGFQLEAPPIVTTTQTQDTPSETTQSSPPPPPQQQKQHGEQGASTNGKVTETAADATRT